MWDNRWVLEPVCLLAGKKNFYETWGLQRQSSTSSTTLTRSLSSVLSHSVSNDTADWTSLLNKSSRTCCEHVLVEITHTYTDGHKEPDTHAASVNPSVKRSIQLIPCMHTSHTNTLRPWQHDSCSLLVLIKLVPSLWHIYSILVYCTTLMNLNTHISVKYTLNIHPYNDRMAGVTSSYQITFRFMVDCMSSWCSSSC